MSDLVDIKTRLNRIEAKLDGFINDSVANKKDIAWLKGSVKFTITTGIAVVGLLLTLYMNIHSK